MILQLLISLWVYACSQGIGSAREVARRCRTGLTMHDFVAITANCGIDSHTPSCIPLCWLHCPHQKLSWQAITAVNLCLAKTLAGGRSAAYTRACIPTSSAVRPAATACSARRQAASELSITLSYRLRCREGAESSCCLQAQRCCPQASGRSRPPITRTMSAFPGFNFAAVSKSWAGHQLHLDV